jgi:tetratricopeptide (TPR) repeat protein
MHKLLIILVLATTCSLYAQVRKEFALVEELYQSGQLEEVADKLSRLKPNRDEERALLQYYSALLSKTKEQTLQDFMTAANDFPKTHYGQLAMLEAAKIHILEREIPLAQTQLRRISSADIIERFYWMAVTYFWLEDYSSAIANAENYLRLKPSGAVAESALHLVSDSYIAQKKYQSAISTLAKIKKLMSYDEQYYYFRLGCAQELSGDSAAALNAFRTGYEMDKYSQVAFNIEERLFALRAWTPSLDLSFLYPYSPLELDPTEAIQDSTALADAVPSESITDTLMVRLPPIDSSIPIKLLLKPVQGSYLQAGRFSVESNAERLTRSIRRMKIPAVYYEDKEQSNTTWVVLAGPFADPEQSNLARQMLTNSEINSFVVQY